MIIKEVCSDYLNHIKTSIIIEPRQFKPSYEEFIKKVDIIAKSVFANRDGPMTLRDLQKYRKTMVG